MSRGTTAAAGRELQTLRERIRARAGNYVPEGIGPRLAIEIKPAPFRSTNPVYLVDLIDPAGGGRRTLFAKVTPPAESAARGGREFAMLGRLYGHPALLEAGIAVPRPIDYVEDLGLLVTEFVPGEKLGSIVRRTCGLFSPPEAHERAAALVSRCGRGLRALHAVTATGAFTPVPDALSGKIADTHRYLLEQRWLAPSDLPGLPETVRSALALLDGCSWPVVRQHGDFCPGNVIVCEGRPTVIDFTFASESVAASDLGRFFAALDHFNPYPANLLFDFRVLGRLRSALLDGYFGADGNITGAEALLVHLYRLRNLLVHFRSRGPSFLARGGRPGLYGARLVYRAKLRAVLAEVRRRGECCSAAPHASPELPEVLPPR